MQIWFICLSHPYSGSIVHVSVVVDFTLYVVYIRSFQISLIRPGEQQYICLTHTY
jgi:hypothetical protein